jgi:outer membrane protein TolC
MNTQAQLLQAQTSLDQSLRDLHVSQQALSQSIGNDHFTAIQISGTWATPEAPKPRPDFEAIVTQHPRMVAQQAVADQARAAIKTAHSALWPTLSLNYSRGTQGRTEFPRDPFWVFTGNVNYPLFGNGPTATYYAGVAAERAYESARQDLRSLRNQLQTDLETAWARYVDAEDAVHVQRAFLNAAKQRKDESDVRYRSGLMTFENWIIVVQDYVNFQQSYLRAEQNLILAEAQWRFATGEALAG